MKKIILTTAIFISCLAVKVANAQISFSLNIGSQPEWGPVGYDHADYYYMPDIDSYYDVPNHQYVYYEDKAWVHRTSLPVRYRSYNVYNGYKVVINERTPWERNTAYRTKYASYRGHTGQTIIRDSRDVKYRDHWVANNEVRHGRKEVRQDRKEVRHDKKELHHDRKENRKDKKHGH